MKILIVAVVPIPATAAAGVAVSTHLPKSDGLETCCDNHSRDAPPVPKS